MELFSRSYAFLKEILNTTLDLSAEKATVIKSLSVFFKEQYINGATDRLVVASITNGESSFKHSMSTSTIRSGFMLTIQNDDNLSKAELEVVASIILVNRPFVRHLLTMGFDTLVLNGKNYNSLKFKISDSGEMNLEQYNQVPPRPELLSDPKEISKKNYMSVFWFVVILVAIFVIIKTFL